MRIAWECPETNYYRTVIVDAKVNFAVLIKIQLLSILLRSIITFVIYA